MPAPRKTGPRTDPGLLAPRKTGPRTDPGLLALAERLKNQAPKRTAAHITEILDAYTGGGAPQAAHDPTPLRPHWAGPPARGRPATAFGRFEADQVNDLWTGDALHGPTVGGRKTYLFAFIDDHSRLLTG